MPKQQMLAKSYNEKKGDKLDANALMMMRHEQGIISPPQHHKFSNTHDISFQQQSQQSMDKQETELIQSMQQILKLSSDKLQKTSTASKLNTFSLSQKSEETSRFQPTAFEKTTNSSLVKPLDLASLTIQNNNQQTTSVQQETIKVQN